MKKTIVSALALLSLSSFAAKDEVVTIQVADAPGVIAAVSKVGSMAGFPMLGGMVAQQVAGFDLYKFFGNARPDGTITLAVFSDLEKLSSSGCRLDNLGELLAEDSQIAILYPVKSKEAFLAKYKNAVATNGCYLVKDDSLRLLGTAFVKFSEDGRWAAANARCEMLDAMLAKVPSVSKPIGDDALRFMVGEKAMPVFVQAFFKSLEYQQVRDGLPPVKDADEMRKLKSCMLALGITDKGIDLHGKFGMSKGSSFDTIGRKALPANPFAFAGDDSFIGYAIAENSGLDPALVLGMVGDALEKKGIKLDFFSSAKKDGSSVLTLDCAALKAFFDRGGAKAFKKLDGNQFVKELQDAACELGKGRTSFPAASGCLSVKGAKASATLAERFARIVPDAQAKGVYMANVVTLYGFLRALADQAVAIYPAEETQQFMPLLATLPPAGNGGLGIVQWREGDDVCFSERITDDEVRGLATIGALASGICGGGCCADDNGECDGDDD